MNSECLFLICKIGFLILVAEGCKDSMRKYLQGPWWQWTCSLLSVSPVLWLLVLPMALELPPKRAAGESTRTTYSLWMWVCASWVALHLTESFCFLVCFNKTSTETLHFWTRSHWFERIGSRFHSSKLIYKGFIGFYWDRALQGAHKIISY